MEKEKPVKKEDVKFDFTRNEYNYFCEQCMFSELQEQILEMKIKEKSKKVFNLKKKL